MSVLKGEGTHPILFGTDSIPVRTLTHTAYVARPDLGGVWPTVMIVGGAKGLSSPVRDLCRRLARHGLVAVAPDLYGGAMVPDEAEAAAEAFRSLDPSSVQRVLDDVGQHLAARRGPWDTAAKGFGIVAIQAGARAGLALSLDFGSPLVMMAPNLREISPGLDNDFIPLPAPPGVLELMVGMTEPLLGLIGRDDVVSPMGDVAVARDVAPHAQWVVYDHVGHDFLDDNEPGFDQPAFVDAIGRTIEFFAKNL